MRRVQQEDADGCGVAVVAMLLGIDYSAAKALLAKPFARGRLSHIDIDAALADASFAIVTRYRYDPLALQKREDWPVRPFAPAHYAIVQVPAGPHAIAIDAEGRVFDPWTEARLMLAHPDYTTVDQITGVWRVS